VTNPPGRRHEWRPLPGRRVRDTSASERQKANCRTVGHAASVPSSKGPTVSYSAGTYGPSKWNAATTTAGSSPSAAPTRPPWRASSYAPPTRYPPSSTNWGSDSPTDTLHLTRTGTPVWPDRDRCPHPVQLRRVALMAWRIEHLCAPLGNPTTSRVQEPPRSLGRADRPFLGRHLPCSARLTIEGSISAGFVVGGRRPRDRRLRRPPIRRPLPACPHHAAAQPPVGVSGMAGATVVLVPLRPKG
jgi:hypothetical protein